MHLSDDSRSLRYDLCLSQTVIIFSVAPEKTRKAGNLQIQTQYENSVNRAIPGTCENGIITEKKSARPRQQVLTCRVVLALGPQ